MKVVALLCWYDEDETFLERAIRSAAAAGVTELAALDGPYALFDEDMAVRSGVRQVKTIRRTCRDLGLNLVLHQPAVRWPTEMAKRSFLFEMGELITAPDDWYLVLDGDYDVHSTAPLPELLADVTEDVATVTLLTPQGPNGRAQFGPAPVMAMRCLFRAIRGIRVEGNHYTYVAPDGRRLWGNETVADLAPVHDLTTQVGITHWTYHRSRIRIGRQFDYYRARDRAGLELGTCTVCKTERVAMMVPTDFRLVDGGFDASWLEVCAFCEPAALDSAVAQAEALGIDPAEARVRVPLTVNE